VTPRQPADAAANGEPSNTGLRHDADRHGQTERLRLPIEVAEDYTWLHADGRFAGSSTLFSSVR
jgi:hypothetical protein